MPSEYANDPCVERTALLAFRGMFRTSATTGACGMRGGIGNRDHVKIHTVVLRGREKIRIRLEEEKLRREENERQEELVKQRREDEMIKIQQRGM